MLQVSRAKVESLLDGWICGFDRGVRELEREKKADRLLEVSLFSATISEEGLRMGAGWGGPQEDEGQSKCRGREVRRRVEGEMAQVVMAERGLL